MRFLIIIILICLSHFYANGNSVDICSPDTIPPPPPGGPGLLTGPSSACPGDISVYTTEVPVACTCQWAVNGEIQPENTPSFSILWTLPGNYIVSVLFVCEGGQTSEPNAILTHVGDMPPDVDLGSDTLLQIGQTLLLDAGNPGCSYLWSTGATTQTILVTVSGTYSVQATNECGADSDEITVTILVGLPEANWQDRLVLASSGHKLRIVEIPDNIEKMQVFDLTGRLIYDGKPQKEMMLPSPGNYILKAISPGMIFTRKFIIR